MTIKQLNPKKCKSCGEIFKPFSSLAKVCSMACSLDYVGKENQKKERKESVKQKREFRLNDKSFQRAKAQAKFNEYIRLRDKDLGCISCDKPADWSGQWHAGHYKTTAARPDLRFNEDNCHKQCSVCNNYLSGNLAVYRINLMQRIGLDNVLVLEMDTEKPKKYTTEHYRNIHKEYQQKIKAMKEV
jgi:hypothetical protein